MHTFSIFAGMLVEQTVSRFGRFFFFLFLLCTATGICKAAETYEYDANNRLVRVHDGTVRLEFVYDGAGNRIAIQSDENQNDDTDPIDGGCFISAAAAQNSNASLLFKFRSNSGSHTPQKAVASGDDIGRQR